MYHLLFCDHPELFKNQGGTEPDLIGEILWAAKPDFDQIRKIAHDRDQDSRVRMLAFNALRAAKREVSAKELLGTVVEVSLPGGLDTLAAFADGGARYINHTGKMIFVEGASHAFEAEVAEVLRASRSIVDVIGPWDKDRLPAPAGGNVRMTFLVSDGLYFGEGPMNVMQHEPMAAPLIQAATALLVKLTEKSVSTDKA